MTTVWVIPLTTRRLGYLVKRLTDSTYYQYRKVRGTGYSQELAGIMETVEKSKLSMHRVHKLKVALSRNSNNDNRK
jgi:hypothetical protein